MTNATAFGPYVHAGAIVYTEPRHVVGTASVVRCQAHIGRHHVADVTKAGPRYTVAGLYAGDATFTTTDRREIPELVRKIAQRTPWNPKDCQVDCQH